MSSVEGVGAMSDLADMVNSPPHYTDHPSGVECIQITEHENFCIGNAIKYLWRTDSKDDPIENLRKAEYYVRREIARRLALDATKSPVHTTPNSL